MAYRYKCRKTKTVVAYVERGTTLQELIEQAKDLGITDLSTVTFDCEYVSGCCGGHSEGEYCYCESGYNDLRFVVSGGSK